jgi:hypothetical protein
MVGKYIEPKISVGSLFVTLGSMLSTLALIYYGGQWQQHVNDTMQHLSDKVMETSQFVQTLGHDVGNMQTSIAVINKRLDLQLTMEPTTVRHR